MVAAAVGLVFSISVFLFEIRIQRASLRRLIGAAIGSILGILGAYLMGLVLARTTIPEGSRSFLDVGLLLVMGGTAFVRELAARPRQPGDPDPSKNPELLERVQNLRELRKREPKMTTTLVMRELPKIPNRRICHLSTPLSVHAQRAAFDNSCGGTRKSPYVLLALRPWRVIARLPASGPEDFSWGARDEENPDQRPTGGT